jgi:hypothetical protein
MKSYVVTYGYDLLRGGKRITGSDFINAESFEQAWIKAGSLCSRTERVLYVDEYIKPLEDKDLLDYESIEVI